MQTPPQHTSYKDLLSTWQEVEELGFDSAFVFDHFIPIYSHFILSLPQATDRALLRRFAEEVLPAFRST